MKRFQWRLQRVLDIKAGEEELRQAEFVELTGRLTRIRSEWLVQKQLLQEALAGLCDVPPQERFVQQALFLKYSGGHDRKLKQLEAQIRQLETLQREKLAELMKLKRFKEGLEKLRERAKTEFLEAQERIEQKELDDMATLRYAMPAEEHVLCEAQHTAPEPSLTSFTSMEDDQ